MSSSFAVQQASARLQSRILVQLDDLIEQSRILSSVQHTNERNLEQLSFLQQQCEALVSQRNTAHFNALVHASVPFATFFSQSRQGTQPVSGSSASVSTVPAASEEMKAAIIANFPDRVSKRVLSESFAAYRMSGITFFAIDQDTIAVQFDTFYKNKFFEAYFLFLEYDATGSSQHFKISKHSLPFFVPVEQIVAQFAKTDLQSVLQRISQHVVAFVSRREQVLELKARAASGEIEKCEVSNSYDLWDIAFRNGVQIKAICELQHMHPVEARITRDGHSAATDEKTPAVFAQAQELLKTLFLFDVVERSNLYLL
eukprot:ANDGO_03816.mRNA.1 hypothetical protein PTSG_02205